MTTFEEERSTVNGGWIRRRWMKTSTNPPATLDYNILIVGHVLYRQHIRIRRSDLVFVPSFAKPKTKPTIWYGTSCSMADLKTQVPSRNEGRLNDGKVFLHFIGWSWRLLLVAMTIAHWSHLQHVKVNRTAQHSCSPPNILIWPSLLRL